MPDDKAILYMALGFVLGMAALIGFLIWENGQQG